MRRRAVATLIAVLAATFVAVPLGIADTVTGTDPSGDVEGSPSGGAAGADIVRATAGTDRRGRLKHTVTFAGTAPDPKGTATAPLLHIELPDQPNPVAECAVYVGPYKGRVGVFRCGTNELLGSAKIVRASSNTLRFTFSRRALGSPASYDWAAVSRARTTTNGSWTRYDRLPNGDDEFLSYSLR